MTKTETDSVFGGLAALLNDPQPGLVSWCEAFQAEIDRFSHRQATLAYLGSEVVHVLETGEVPVRWDRIETLAKHLRLME